MSFEYQTAQPFEYQTNGHHLVFFVLVQYLNGWSSMQDTPVLLPYIQAQWQPCSQTLLTTLPATVLVNIACFQAWEENSCRILPSSFSIFKHSGNPVAKCNWQPCQQKFQSILIKMSNNQMKPIINMFAFNQPLILYFYINCCIIIIQVHFMDSPAQVHLRVNQHKIYTLKYFTYLEVLQLLNKPEA